MSAERKAKYDAQSAQEVKEWIEEVIGEEIGPAGGDLMEALKDGIAICKVANKIIPEISHFKQSRMPFVQMENIASFLRAAEKIGVPHHELFETVDLYEEQDPVQVLITLRALSRHGHEKNSSIPLLGPKLVSPNQRKHFSKQAATDIPAWNERQYGFMGGASQGTEGVVFGGRRDIIAREQKPAPPPPKIQFSASGGTKTAPKPPPKPMNLRQNPLANEDEDEEDNNGKMDPKSQINTQLTAHGDKSALQAKQIEDSLGSEVFAYDEVYDNMKSAEASFKAESEKDKNERRPKYIEQLLQTKSVREKDRQRARDVKLKREREAEGDEFADKEMFVTSAYKKHQQELEEQAKQDEKNEQGSMAGFYRNALDQAEERHNAIVHATKASKLSPSTSSTEAKDTDPVAERARKINEEAGYNKVTVNDNGEIVDERQAFGAGLNIISSKKPAPSSSGRHGQTSVKSHTSTRDRTSSRRAPSQELSTQYYQHKQAQQQKESESKEKLISQMKSSKANLQAISEARERYLARKRQQQN